MSRRDPIDWNQAYAEGNTPWDRGEAAPELARLIGEGALGELGPRVLIPGCGRGHDALALAATGFKVTAVDISPLALSAASQLDPEGAVHWKEANVFALGEAGLTGFDWAWEHTCLSGLPPARRSDYFHSIATSLRPGGIWIGIFFLDTEVPLEEGPPFSIDEDDLKSLLSPHFALMEEWSPQAVFEERGGVEFCLKLRKKDAEA